MIPPRGDKIVEIREIGPGKNTPYNPLKGG